MYEPTLLDVVRFLDSVVDGKSYALGLCSAGLIATNGARVDRLVEQVAPSWRHYSGCPITPVPGKAPGKSADLIEYRQCKANGTLYIGTQGEYRRSLAAHLRTFIFFNEAEARRILLVQ